MTTLSLAQAAQASQQPPAGETTIRTNVNLVQVDAIVTDANDRQVTDLKAGDFEILQDGKPQAITNFSYISIKPGGTRDVPAVVPKGTLVPTPRPPVALKPNQVRRTVALVVDDLGLSFASIAQLRSALKKFVDERIEPGDLVAILRTGAGMGALQQFTADKRILYAAIDCVRYNAFGRVGVSSFAPFRAVGTDVDTPRADEERQTDFSVGTIGALRYVVDGLRELPGRKSVIIGYDPDASALDAKTGKPLFHRVKVKVKTAGLQVRSRRAMFGNYNTEAPRVPQGRDAQLARALASPFGSGAIPLRLTSLFNNVAMGGSFVTSLLHIDGRGLTFVDEPDDYHKAVFDVVVKTFGDKARRRTRAARLTPCAYGPRCTTKRWKAG